jgi:uncharacterized protein
MARAPRDLVGSTVQFCRALRERGVLASPAETLAAVRTLDLVDLSDSRELYLALRTVLVGRVEEYPVYDEVFHAFWSQAARGGEQEASAADSARSAPVSVIPPRRQRPDAVMLGSWGGREPRAEEPVAVPGFGERDAYGAKDFSTFSARELEEITRVAARLARRLAACPSRRWRTVRRGDRVHPRRSARNALRTGAELVELAYRERKLHKTKLVLLCDVSGSMDLYSRFLLQFLYAMQNRFARVETFVFSTRLTRLTDQLRERSYREALARLADEPHGWSGGTRIGESLAEFVEGWPRMVDRRTIVVILSDGWDTGDPDVLAGALAAIHRRAGKLIWLNPLLGSVGYQPLTRGMQAALPHVDVFAPAHNLESLRALVRHLRL